MKFDIDLDLKVELQDRTCRFNKHNLPETLEHFVSFSHFLLFFYLTTHDSLGFASYNITYRDLSDIKLKNLVMAGTLKGPLKPHNDS